MSPQLDPRHRRVLGPLASLSVWCVLAALAWLDSDGCAWSLHPGIALHTASVFAFIWSGIQALAGILSSAAEVTIAYLASAVSYLAAHVAMILHSTGAMFAKVWEGVKIVWSDVLRPALQWLDRQLQKFHAWLKSTLTPVFNWLTRVRDYLQDVYKRFVRPIIDTLDFLRALNRALLLFHVTLLQQLDAVLQKVEQRIEEPFLWVYQELTGLWSWIDRVIDIDGYYQRFTLARSMQRYAPDWINHFWRRQADLTAPAGPPPPPLPPGVGDDPEDYGHALADVYRRKDTPITAYVAELAVTWQQAAGARDSTAG
jgi:hypothetical protein